MAGDRNQGAGDREQVSGVQMTEDRRQKTDKKSARHKKTPPATRREGLKEQRTEDE